MAEWRVGVFVDNLGLGVKEGIRAAAEHEFDGIQVYVTYGEMLPANLGKSARRDFRKTVSRLGLTLSALCGDTGLGFFNPATNDKQVESARSFIDLAVDLGTGIVTTHFGAPPEENTAKARAAAVEVLREIGRYAAKREVYFASETGSESPDDLLALIEEISEPYIAVNYDPANLLGRGFDHLGGVGVLSSYIVHTHAKDFRAGEGEVPVGEGDVSFSAYLAALSDIGYDGVLTIERESGADKVGDAVRALRFLKSIPRK